MLAGGQLTVIDTSSVSLRLPPSAPVLATPTEFAPQIGQFPTGEGISKPSAQSFISFGIALFNKRLQNVSIYLCFRETRHFVSLLQWEKVARFTATDEVLLYVYYQNKPNLYMFALRHAPKIQPPCLGDADRVRLRESVNSREVCHSLTWHSSESESAL